MLADHNTQGHYLSCSNHHHDHLPGLYLGECVQSKHLFHHPDNTPSLQVGEHSKLTVNVLPAWQDYSWHLWPDSEWFRLVLIYLHQTW